MRISVWQQFSSNHSGFFWVVGTFETVEDAQHAFEQIRAMLFTIDQWHREHKQESRALSESGNFEPRPPEREFAEKFNARWPATIDWTSWGDYWLEEHPSFSNFNARQAAENLIGDALGIAGCNVTVTNPHQTWMTTQPFEDILAHFGARTIGYDLEFMESEASEGFDMHTRLTFKAPNTATGDLIEAAIMKYLESNSVSPDNVPPWNDDEENFRQVLGVSRVLKSEYIELLKGRWQRRYHLHNYPTPSPFGREMPLQRLALRNNDKLVMKREGLNFILHDVWFHNVELGVSALIAWLEVNGCEDIDFGYIRHIDEEV